MPTTGGAFATPVVCAGIGKLVSPAFGADAGAGHIYSSERSRVSLLRLCEQTFGRPPVTPRTAAADNDTSDCFDYSHALPLPASSPSPAPTPTQLEA